MKSFLKYLAVFFMMLVIVPAANALTFKVVVLPVDILNVCNNYYCFPEASEILANDIIMQFNKTSKVNSPDLYAIRAALSENQDLYNTTASVVRKYDYNNTIDYAGVKALANKFDAKSVMLISSVVKHDKYLAKRSVWEVLEVSSAFDISYKNNLETNVVLLDTVNDIVMWSGNYSKVLNKKNKFTAKNSSQSNSKLDALKMYFGDILSVDIVQNVILRFFPKSASPLETKPAEKADLYKDGSLLQFERNLPKLRQSEDKLKDDIPKEEMGEMIFGF